MKTKIINLRDEIVDNIGYLSNEYQTTNDILYDLNMIVNFEFTYSNMFQWWYENEDKIDIINELLKRQHK